MSNDFLHIIPSPQPKVEEGFASYQTTHEFYQEVQTRSDHERHCAWYYITAQRHRQELQKMRGEFNFLRFFRRQKL